MKELKKIKLKNEKNQNDENDENNFMFYPDFKDPKFYEKIYVKKEFNKNKILKSNVQNEACNPVMYNLSPSQEFLRNFISPDTPYNGILIYHGTGVGKTCSAVQIAEGFKEIMKKVHPDEKRKIIILAGRSITAGFRKEIYDISKESKKRRPDDIVQCTGNTYSLSSDKYRGLTLAQKEREISKNINNVYSFYGYEKFANEVKLLIGWDGNLDTISEHEKNLLYKNFKNRVIIIDEVHNVKTTSDLEFRKVPPILQGVIKYGKNIRLVLMSATPMYDTAPEIIFILNLLLLNDGRELINKEDFFDSNDNLLPGAADKLKEISKGYISYLRGENPYKFPARVYTKKCKVPIIKYDWDQKLIPETNRLQYTKLFSSEMSPYQFEQYMKIYMSKKNSINSIVLSDDIIDEYQEYQENIEQIMKNNKNNKNKNKNENENIFTEEELKIRNKQIQNKDKFSKIAYPLFYVSNIVLPNKLGENVNASVGFAYQKSENGDGPFLMLERIDQKSRKKYLQFKYQNHVIFDKDTYEEKPFLDEKYLKNYSCKYYNALQSIKFGKGISFVFSSHIWGGVLPFALMLEQNGFRRYIVEGEKPLLDYTPNRKGGGGKKEICAICGNLLSNQIHKESNPNYHKFKIATYIIVTGDTAISKIETGQLRDIVNNINNKNGEIVKVIIGTQKTGEGIDFKCIRQIHILEAWYNMARIEQIIGRGIRTCSHVELPESDRNVEVYHHACLAPNNSTQKEKETEMIDTHFYRIAEDKDKKIKVVERILRKSAVDCVLNKNGNYIDTKETVKMITSTGEKKEIKLGDDPYSRNCLYDESCDFKCYWEPGNKEYKINTDTYNIRFAKTDMEKAKRIIKNLYRKDYIYSLERILNNIQNQTKGLDNLFIYQAIQELIDNPNEYLYDRFGRQGNLIYRGRYYVFQPSDFSYNESPVYYKKTPLIEKKKEHYFDMEMLNKKNSILQQEIANIMAVKLKDKDFLSVQEMEISELFDKIKDESPFKLEICIEIVLDRLIKPLKIYFIKELLNQYYENKMKWTNDIQLLFEKYFSENLIYKNRDVNYGKSNNKSLGEIVGFTINKEYYCYNKESKIFSICLKDFEEKIKINMQLRTASKKIKYNYNNIVGYMEDWKSKEIIFKILDLTKNSGTLTMNLKKSKRSEVKGRRCNTFKINDLKNIFEKLNLPFKETNIKDLCITLEYYLRLYDKEKKDNKKWFIIDKIRE